MIYQLEAGNKTIRIRFSGGTELSRRNKHYLVDKVRYIAKETKTNPGDVTITVYGEKPSNQFMSETDLDTIIKGPHRAETIL